MTTADPFGLDERIEKARAILSALEDEMLASLNGGVASFTLDTGQTREVVTQRSIGEIKNAISSATNHLATLIARRDGRGNYGGPAW
jgi:hypothetical protein